MFQELWPLLQRRDALTLMLTRNGDKINVVVIPHEGTVVDAPTEAQIAALRLPIQVIGTPEELDSGIASEIMTKGNELHLTLEDQVKQMSEQAAAARAALEQERKDKQKSKASTAKPVPGATSKPEPPPEPPKKPLPPSLFDAPVEPGGDTANIPASSIEPTPISEPAPTTTEMFSAVTAQPPACVAQDCDLDDEEAELLRTPIEDEMLVEAA